MARMRVHMHVLRETYIVPVLIGKLVTWVPPLDPSAGNEDIRLQSLARDGGNDPLDRFAV